MQVYLAVNMGRKFLDSSRCPLIDGCRLNMGSLWNRFQCIHFKRITLRSDVFKLICKRFLNSRRLVTEGVICYIWGLRTIWAQINVSTTFPYDLRRGNNKIQLVTVFCPNSDNPTCRHWRLDVSLFSTSDKWNKRWLCRIDWLFCFTNPRPRTSVYG